MPLNPNTQKFLADLKAAGLDTTSLESQIAANPLAEKQANIHIGGGILRQADYSRHMNDLKKQEDDLNDKVQQLASLHDARSAGVNLPQESIDVINTLEQTLINTGMFDESSVRELSRVGRVPLERLSEEQQRQSQLQRQNNALQNREVSTNKSLLSAQDQIDTSNLIDVNTFQNSMINMVYGGIATNLEINAHIDELKELGIKVDRQGVEKLKENLRVGTMAGKTVAQVIDETFEVSKAREAKSNEIIENRINEEAEKRVAEQMKKLGVPVTKKFDFGRRHPILDRKRAIPENVTATNGDAKLNEGDNSPALKDNELINNGNLPKNKYGDTEIFRGRRDREGRLQGAVGVYEQVMEHYANDPTFVE